jgi:hypothetical protein
VGLPPPLSVGVDMICTATDVPKALTVGAIVVQIIGLSDWHAVPIIGSRRQKAQGKEAMPMGTKSGR